jgi:hypothetical protein
MEESLHQLFNRKGINIQNIQRAKKTKPEKANNLINKCANALNRQFSK